MAQNSRSISASPIRITGWADCRGLSGRVNSCKFLESQKAESGYFVTGGADSVVRLWNSETEKEPLLLHEFKGGHPGGDVLDVSCNSGGSRLASVGLDKAVCIWDVISGTPWARLHGHEAQINSTSFRDATLLGTASNDGSVRLWDVRTKSSVQVLPRFRDAATSVVLKDSIIYCCSLDGSLKRFDVRSGAVSIDETNCPLGSLAVSNDRARVAASCVDQSDARIVVMDGDTGASKAVLRGYVNGSVSLKFSFTKDDDGVCCGSEEGTLRVWEVESGNIRLEVSYGEPLLSVSHHSEAQSLVISGAKGLLRIIRYQSE